MLRRIGACFVFISIHCASLLQAQQIYGVVRSEDGVALPGVHVLVIENDRGTITDGAGRYALEGLGEGVYTLSFSFVGFHTHSATVSLAHDDVELNVYLRADVVEAEEILVVEDRETILTRDPRSVTVLEPEDLFALRGQTLGAALKQLPGVTALQTGPSISKPVIRGLHSQRLLVLNAGISQEGQQWGGEHAPEIDPFAPVKIEVIRGVAGVEYGVGAIGGVIRLEPLELPYLPDHGVTGRLALNGFSNNVQGAGSLYLEGAARRLAGLGWRVQGSFRKAGDTHTPDYVVPNSAFQEFSGSASMGIRREHARLLAYYSRFSTELGIFTGAHIGNLNDLLRAIERGRPAGEAHFGYRIDRPKQRISHDLFTVHGDYRLPSGDLLEAQYGFQWNHRQEFDAHGRRDDAAADRPAFDLSLISHSLELKVQHRPLGRWVGVAGVTGMNQLNRNDAAGFLIPNFRALSGGVFARESWVNDWLTVEAGLRYDYRWVRAWPRADDAGTGAFVRRITDYSGLSGVLGTIWQFADTWSIAGHLGTGWRPPGVNELYNFGVHHGTAQFEIGDPDLRPERTLGIDATLRHRSDRSRLEVSVYTNRFDGFIHLFPDPEPRVTIRGVFPTFRYRQADARIRGVDALIEQDAGRWVTLAVQGSLVRGDNLEADEPLILMPADRLIARLTLQGGDTGILQHPRLSLENVMVRRQDRFPENADYTDPPPGYVLFNASLSTGVRLAGGVVHVNLAVQNALNRIYRDYLSRFRYFIDDPGRSVVLRLQIPINDSS